MTAVKRKHGSIRGLASALLFVIWFLKALLGLIAMIGERNASYSNAIRGFPHPYMGDFEYYVILPAMFAALNLLVLLFPGSFPRWLVLALMALQLFALFVLLFLGSGGI